MTQTLTANTARPNLAIALVAGLTQPYTPKAFPRLVFGETVEANLYLIDNGAYDARSGLAGYTPRVSITLDDQKPSGGTFTIGDGTDTTDALDWDATEAEIETALNALNTDTGPYGDTVTVDKYANGAFTVFFDSVGSRAELTVAASGIQPVSTASILPIVEGDATTREQQLIQIKASPLVFADGGALITDGWRMTLDANNANFLQATALEAISANYSIEVVSPTSTVDVVARGPVILEPATFDVAALNGVSYPDIPTGGEYVHERLDITGLDGSTITDLDYIATVDLELNYTVLTGVTIGVDTPGKTWALEAGTDANNPAGGVVRPDDYATTTNEKVWKVQQ